MTEAEKAVVGESANSDGLANSHPGRRQTMAAIRPITLVDQVVEAFIHAAAEGRILPGDRVVEGDIAGELQVSRVPVREALRLLESQGIVVNTPYRGMRLMEVDGKRVHQILVVRASLEQLAAGEAAAACRSDPGAVAGLGHALSEMKRAVDEQDGFAHARADIAFHRSMCQITGNEVLLQLWETLARRLTIIFGLAALQKDLDSIYQEHVELLELLKRGSLKAIHTAVEEHIIGQSETIDFDALIAARRRLRQLE